MCPCSLVALPLPSGDELTVFDGHVAAVNCVQLLDDGGLVSGGADNLVKVAARWGGGVSFPVW